MEIFTEGIVLKTVPVLRGRMMVTVFTEKYGKICAGIFQSTGRKKAALKCRPFSLGNFQITERNGAYNIKKLEIESAFFSIGEDPERFFTASYILELTEKVLPEGVKDPYIYSILKDFLNEVCNRKKGFETLAIAWQLKLLLRMGSFPETESCVLCGEKKNLIAFSVASGGAVCEICAEEYRKRMEESGREEGFEELIYQPDFDIIKVIEYFKDNSLGALSRLCLKSEAERILGRIVREYTACHLGVSGLKSEQLML